jgi:hypothetical protein
MSTPWLREATFREPIGHMETKASSRSNRPAWSRGNSELIASKMCDSPYAKNLVVKPIHTDLLAL